MKLLQTIGILAVAFLSYVFGFYVGDRPTDEEVQNETRLESARQDLVSVSGLYQSLYNLCEEKYQTALSGDWSTALRINGQMDTLSNQIDTILEKY